MIKLKLKVVSFYYLGKNYEKHFKEYKINVEYDDNMVFDEVLKEIHKKYKINNKTFENYFIPHLTELLWKQYFSDWICYHIDDNDEDYYKLKLYELEKQFNISKIEIPILLNYDGIGKAIGTVEGVKMYFHLDEKDLHHNPHIHCKYSGEETRVEIETLKSLDKPFKKSKMDAVKKVLLEHQEELLNYWNKAIIDGQPIELNIEI